MLGLKKRASRKRRGAIAGASLALAVGAVLATASPAMAGEWFWGEKNCINAGYVVTHSYGSGTVMHAQIRSGVVYNKQYIDGTFTRSHDWTSYNGIVSSASVAGPSTSQASIYCG